MNFDFCQSCQTFLMRIPKSERHFNLMLIMRLGILPRIITCTVRMTLCIKSLPSYYIYLNVIKKIFGLLRLHITKDKNLNEVSLLQLVYSSTLTVTCKFLTKGRNFYGSMPKLHTSNRSPFAYMVETGFYA